MDDFVALIYFFRWPSSCTARPRNSKAEKRVRSVKESSSDRMMNHPYVKFSHSKKSESTCHDAITQLRPYHHAVSGEASSGAVDVANPSELPAGHCCRSKGNLFHHLLQRGATTAATSKVTLCCDCDGEHSPSPFRRRSVQRGLASQDRLRLITRDNHLSETEPLDLLVVLGWSQRSDRARFG